MIELQFWLPVLAQLFDNLQREESSGPLRIFLLIVLGLVGLVIVTVFWVYGGLWLQAYMSRSDVTLASLIGMGFRGVNPRMIVTAKVMAAQAGLDIDRRDGVSTSRLEAHFLAGGDVMRVIHAIIAAQRAGIPLGFRSSCRD